MKQLFHTLQRKKETNKEREREREMPMRKANLKEYFNSIRLFSLLVFLEEEEEEESWGLRFLEAKMSVGTYWWYLYH